MISHSICFTFQTLGMSLFFKGVGKVGNRRTADDFAKD